MAAYLLLVISVLLVLSMHASHAAKVLIYPVDCGFNSRLMNLVKIADILNANGHNATVLVNNKIAKMLQPEGTTLTVYNIPHAENLPFITDEAVLAQFKELSLLGMGTLIKNWLKLQLNYCEYVVGTNLINDLKAEGYDLVIIDTIWDCGRILIDYLDVPSMTYSNWGFVIEPLVYYPYLPSFVCSPGSEICLSDKMNFAERIGNFIQQGVYVFYIIPKAAAIYDEFKERFNLNITRSIRDSVGYKSLSIVNVDFVLDYPRPTMPHVIMIPGLYHRSPKLLPDDLLSFIEASAPHGLVLVSFGSMVSKIDVDKAEIFAKVLGELPQSVLWRHTGKIPRTLKENTRLVRWFPQADIMGHPLMRLFVTHCGISSTYEAAMNAIPVIAIPLFLDQHYQSRKLTERAGMGVRIELDTMTETIFREAVTEVMSNKTYLRNAQRTAMLLKDEEVPAQKKLLYWVEYAIRHNGARHLISETALGMSNFVFYSVDVILVIIAMVLTMLFLMATIFYCLVKFTYKQIIRNKKVKTI